MNRFMNHFRESLIILSLFVITNGYCEDSKEKGDKSSEKVERSEHVFNVSNKFKPSDRYFEKITRSVRNGSKYNDYDYFWIENIYSEDRKQKLSIRLDFSPYSLATGGKGNLLYIQNNDNSPFETQLITTTNFIFSDGRTFNLQSSVLRGGLPVLFGKDGEVNLINYLVSESTQDKSWTISVVVPNRKPIIFKDVKIDGLKDAVIKFRTGKWEKSEID